MKAFTLLFGEDPTRLHAEPGRDENSRSVPDAERAGWLGSDGPQLGNAWPLSPVTRLPMAHIFTIRLPRDYQRKGPDFPAIAFYAGEGQFADEDASPTADAGSNDPFLVWLASAIDHPQLQLREDIIGGAFALVWLTEAEFEAGPGHPPIDVRREGEWDATDEGLNAWDYRYPVTSVWLADRIDPNAGRAPVETPDEGDGYESPFTDNFEFTAWAEPLWGLSHLGGTAFPVQAMPEGLTPYYLEIDEIAGLNFGSGSCQIDLESDTFDWAC